MMAEKVEKYVLLTKELDSAYRQLQDAKNEYVSDCVQSFDGAGYSKRSLTIRGYGDVHKIERIKRRIHKLEEDIEAIDRFVDGINDDEVRVIVKLKCLEGMKWKEISGEIGCSKRTVERKYKNFFKVDAL